MKSKRPHGLPPREDPRFDFDRFIQRVKTLSLPEIVMEANAAGGHAESISYGHRGSVAARESGSMEFAKKTKDLSFFLQNGFLPAGNHVATSVAKGQMPKDVLDGLKAG